MQKLGFLSGAAVVLISCQALGQLVIYDNFAPSGWTPYYPASGNNAEFGDEISLPVGTPRLVRDLKVQYYAENLSGDEWVQVRLYHNDGPIGDDGFPTPQTILYQSKGLVLTERDGQGVLNLDRLNLWVPDSFTWTVQFNGLGANEVVGLTLMGPPTTGMSYGDFWEKVDGVWKLVQLEDPQLSSFGAQITATAVPEPFATAFVFLGIAGAAAAISRWKRRV